MVSIPDQLTQNLANSNNSNPNPPPISTKPRKKTPLVDFSATYQDLLNYCGQYMLAKHKDLVEFKKEIQLSYNKEMTKQESDWKIRKAKEFQAMKTETDKITKNCQHKYNNSVQKPKYDQWSLLKVICEEEGEKEKKESDDKDLVSVYIDHKGKKIFDLSMGVVQARYHHNKWKETLKKYKEEVLGYFDGHTNDENGSATAVENPRKPNGLPFCEAEDLLTIKKLLKTPNSAETDITCLTEDQKIKLNEWLSDSFIELIHSPTSPRNSDQLSSGRADSPTRKDSKEKDKNERNEIKRLNDTLTTPTKVQANSSGRQSGSGSDRSSDREKAENKENVQVHKVKGLLDTPDKAMLCENSSRLAMIPRPREVREQNWRNKTGNYRRVSDPEALISPPPVSFRLRNQKITEENPRNVGNPKEIASKNQNNNHNRDEGRVPFTKVENRYQHNRFQRQNSNIGQNRNGYSNYNNGNNKQQIVNPKTGYQPRNIKNANSNGNINSNFQVPALPGTNSLTKMSASNTSLKENNPIAANSNFSSKAKPFRPKNFGRNATAATVVPASESQNNSKKIDLKKLNVSTIAAFVPKRNPLVTVQNN